MQEYEWFFFNFQFVASAQELFDFFFQEVCSGIGWIEQRKSRIYAAHLIFGLYLPW